MAPSAGCSLQEICRGRRLTSWQSPRFKAVFIMLVCLPVLTVVGLPAVKPRLVGNLEGEAIAEAKERGVGGAAGTERETAKKIALNTLFMAAIAQKEISKGLRSSKKDVLVEQLSADKVVQESSPHQAAVESKASPSLQHSRSVNSLTHCLGNTSNGYAQTSGGVKNLPNRPTDLSYESPELVEERFLIDVPWGEDVLAGSDLDAGKVASASFSFFDWSRRKLLNHQLELQRLDTSSETKPAEEVDFSPILRLTHRAKTERQTPPLFHTQSLPPWTGIPFFQPRP